jgi:glycosyltransferase involved in cell wall biosynthesis
MQNAISTAEFAVAASEETPLFVSVIIPCYNQAQFLSEAIESVLGQTYRRWEVVVVDDGSTDDTSGVARRYPQVRSIVQLHQGLAAARNTGVRHSRGCYVVFLDADDRLLPRALEIGVEHLAANPKAAFVSGRHRRIAADGTGLERKNEPVVQEDHYLALLRGNYVGMHGAVMYRRDALEAAQGFDPSLPCCEDYDLYLRLARRFPVACHEELVAEYRLHGANMSRNRSAMVATAVRVLRTEATRANFDERRRKAYHAGVAAWRAYYGSELLQDLQRDLRDGPKLGRALRSAVALLRHSPGWLVKSALRHLKRRAASLLHRQPRPGRVRWGHLRRLTPVSRRFGYERGLPIDRYYIDRFLASHSGDIRGRVLEVGDRTYTIRFGGERVTRSDVLHVCADNRVATLVGDLTRADHIPGDSFDCILLTQTLHLLYDLRAATATLHRILKPGGVLLATVPGISQLEDGQWARTWYWSFTRLSASRLFSEAFPDVDVRTWGNVLAATGFLQGLAAEELQDYELDHYDPLYQLVITIRAVKATEPK